MTIVAHEVFRRDLDRIKKMDAQEERKELEAHAAGDLEAGKRIVSGHLRLVLNTARAYARRDQDLYEELVCVGYEGACHAMSVFDHSAGTRFWAYAKHHVAVRIQRFMHRNRRIVAAPFHGPMYAAIRAYRIHKPETVEELAALAGITLQYATEAWTMCARSDAGCASDEPLSSGGMPLILEIGRSIPDPATMTLTDPVAAIDHGPMSYAVRLAVMKLDQREQAIARRRLMSDDPATLQEIATDYGVCRERIRQIEKRVVRKLREALAQWREAA